MAHYAFLDENNVVTEVIVGVDETETIEGIDPETWYGQFRGQKSIRTSYSGKIRKNYAGIDFIYHAELDAFSPPKCHDEAILNPDTALWNCDNDDHSVM